MRTLLFDVETAPNISMTWGLFNQNISLNQLLEPGYTLCFAAKWLDKKQITFKSIHHDGVDKMLTTAHDLMSEADAIIHYNGIKFDIPVLNSEFLKHDFAPPAPSTQVDLYRTIKRNFRLTSNKLDFVARHLGIEGKVQHKGMDLWRGCMAGDKADWKKMKEYNIQDVLLLEKVYDRVLPWIQDHPNMAHYSSEGVPVCPSCGSTELQRRGEQKSRTMTYQRFQCQACGSWSRARTNNLSKEKKQRVLVKI